MNKEKLQYKNTEKFTPEVISEVLEVKETYGLTAENILRKASKKSSSLYEFFDWDNSSAGEKWRLSQARILINEIKVIVEDKEISAFENVNVTIQEAETPNIKSSKFGSREYKTIVEIMNNEDYRNQLIHSALAQATFWKEKYKELIELEPIFISIDETNKKWQNKK